MRTNNRFIHSERAKTTQLVETIFMLEWNESNNKNLSSRTLIQPCFNKCSWDCIGHINLDVSILKSQWEIGMDQLWAVTNEEYERGYFRVIDILLSLTTFLLNYQIYSVEKPSCTKWILANFLFLCWGQTHTQKKNCVKFLPLK